MRRRTLLRIGLAGGVAGVTGVAAAAPAAALAGFPSFAYAGQPFTAEDLAYNPTGEFIFPCIRGVGSTVSNPLGKWYLYYAPHDAPGGICLAYSNSLDGPWTEYPGNPVIRRGWSPHYSVSHVSSPHAHWDPDTGRMYLFFHGENTTTRVASSTDGRTFSYVGTVMSTSKLPSNVTEASYARVFPYAIPGRGNRYIMLFMGNQDGTRKIFLATSTSLTSGWTAQQKPLISPAAGENGQLSAPHYWSRNGGGHVVHHSGAGTIHVTDVGTAFDRENHLGVLHRPRSSAPDNGRAAAPSFAVSGGHLYMFYEAGSRLAAGIAYAKAPV